MQKVVMKQLLPFLVLSLVLVTFAHAEKADSTKPTNVEANQMAYDDAKQINTFSGNVVLTRGTLTMKAGRVVVKTDPDGFQLATMYAAPGSVATFRQRRDGGPDLWIEGQAERIEYDSRTEVAKLFSKAQVRRLDGTKVTDDVQGEYISYDSKSEFYSVNNSASGDGRAGGGRVKAVIQPRPETKAQE